MCYRGDVDYDILSCCHGNKFIGMIIKVVMIFCMLLYYNYDTIYGLDILTKYL